MLAYGLPFDRPKPSLDIHTRTAQEEADHGGLVQAGVYCGGAGHAVGRVAGGVEGAVVLVVRRDKLFFVMLSNTMRPVLLVKQHCYYLPAQHKPYTWANVKPAKGEGSMKGRELTKLAHPSIAWPVGSAGKFCAMTWSIRQASGPHTRLSAVVRSAQVPMGKSGGRKGRGCPHSTMTPAGSTVDCGCVQLLVSWRLPSFLALMVT